MYFEGNLPKLYNIYNTQRKVYIQHKYIKRNYLIELLLICHVGYR